jgi:hypothetical protein
MKLFSESDLSQAAWLTVKKKPDSEIVLGSKTVTLIPK